MIDEFACRKNPQIVGEPVVLADGQEWTLPRPHRLYAYAPQPPGFKTRLTFGEPRDREADGRLNDLVALADGAGDDADFLSAAFGLAALLLSRHYDLTDDQLGELLVYAPGDPAAAAMIRAIYDLATAKTGRPEPGDETATEPEPTAAEPEPTAA